MLRQLWVLTRLVDKLRFRKKNKKTKRNHARLGCFFPPKCIKRGENQLSLEVRSTAVQLAVLAAPPPSGHYPNDSFTFYNKTKNKKRGYMVFYVDDDGHTSRRCSLVKRTNDPCSQSETSQQITAPFPAAPPPPPHGNLVDIIRGKNIELKKTGMSPEATGCHIAFR